MVEIVIPVSRPSSSAAKRLLEHCAALDPERQRPNARDRLDEALGRDLSRQLVFALTPDR